MVRTRQMRRSKGSKEIDTLPLLVVENRKNEDPRIKTNRNNSTPNKKDYKLKGNSSRKGDEENDTQPLLNFHKGRADDHETMASQKGIKVKGSKVATKLDRQPLRATDHYPTSNYFKMHDMNISLNKSASFESTDSQDSTEVYKKIHSAEWVEIYNNSKLANDLNGKMREGSFDNKTPKITMHSEIFRRVEAITSSENMTSEVNIKPTNAKTKLSLKDYFLAHDFCTKSAEADISSVDACLADIQLGESEESSLFPEHESRDDCPNENDPNLHMYIGEKVATMLKQEQKENRTDSSLEEMMKEEPTVKITSQSDSSRKEEMMKEEPAVKVKIHTYTDAELFPVEKSNSKCFQSIRVDSLVSICLLDLKNNGTKMSASSRLKHALNTGNLQSKQSDLEKNKCQIILEDIDNEEDYLWSVTITLPVDTSQKRHSIESDKSENAKSHLYSFLEHGELDKASDYLRQKLKVDGGEHDVITWVNLAAIELSLGYYGDAVRSFKSTKTMEDNAPREARTLSLLGMALYGDGKFEEANQYYLRALTILRTKEQGYGRYNQYHDMVMGQLFNSVGCSFHERGFHKSSERSFLNALHVYLQDIIGKEVNTEEAQSVEYLLNKVNECKDWVSLISSSYLLDTAITFNNLACVLINKNSYLAAISCLRLSLKLQGTGNTVVDQDIMIATLEEVGKSYVAIQNFKDAEHIYNFIFKTNREDFNDIQAFHQTKCRVSSIMKSIQLEVGKPDVAKKYADLEEYHRNAAIDAVKIEKMCTTLSSTKMKEEGRDDENTIMTLDSIKSSYDLMNADSATE